MKSLVEFILEHKSIKESVENVDGKLIRTISKHIVLSQEFDKEMDCSYVIIFKDKQPVGLVPDYDNNIMDITAVEAKNLIKDYIKK